MINLLLQSSQHPGGPHPSFLAAETSQGGPPTPAPRASLASILTSSLRTMVLC